jgi:glycosyltransferase involved in cell wall biosynthesis
MHVGVSLLTLFPGRVGGSEMYVRGLLDAFQDVVDGPRVTILGNRLVGTSFCGWPVRRVRSYRAGRSDLTRFLAMNAGRMWPVLSGGEFDAVHFPLTVPIPNVLTTPRIVTLHDVQHYELPEMFSRAEHWLRGWAYDGAARAANHVVTVSHHAKAGIEYHLGIPSERIHVIPSGIDHRRFHPDGPGPQGLPARYIFYPATHLAHKNHSRLMKAFARITDKSLHLVLTGTPTDHQAFTGSEADRVLFLGRVADEDLPCIYRGALALIFPSLFEGFGFPPLEAMACGIPVASSQRASLAEVVGDAALPFDPEDVDDIASAIERIVADEPLRERLRQAGAQRAGAYTWDVAASRHIEVYEKAIRR